MEKSNTIEGLKKLKTVGKNKKGFSEYQYKRELVARKLYHMIGEPTLKNLKMMIRQNIIHNFPVMVEDVDIEEKIFGPDASTLKVITIRQTPTVVVDDFVEIPRELIENNQELILCMEIMFIGQ